MIVSLLPLPVLEGHYDGGVSDCSCFPYVCSLKGIAG